MRKKADKYSFDLIFDYFLETDGSFIEPGTFIEQYGIPIRMLDYAQTVFREKQSQLI